MEASSPLYALAIVLYFYEREIKWSDLECSSYIFFCILPTTSSCFFNSYTNWR